MDGSLFLSCLGILFFIVFMSIFHVLTVWFFYRIDPKNDWFSENYRKLPRLLRIFDKD